MSWQFVLCSTLLNPASAFLAVLNPASRHPLCWLVLPEGAWTRNQDSFRDFQSRRLGLVPATDSTSTHWCIVSTSRWFVKPGGSVGYHELKAAMRALMLPVKRLGFRNLKNEVKAEGRPGESWWRSDSVVPEICPFSSLGGAHTDAATVVRGESLPRHGSEDFLMLMQLNQESWCVGSNAGLRAQSWCCSTACKYCGRRRTQ